MLLANHAIFKSHKSWFKKLRVEKFYLTFHKPEQVEAKSHIHNNEARSPPLIPRFQPLQIMAADLSNVPVGVPGNSYDTIYIGFEAVG